MPTTRSLRSSTPKIVDYDEGEDEFASAQPIFLSDLYTPDNTPSTKSSTNTKKPSVKKRKVSKKESTTVFECDLNLPEEGGLELETKLFLLSKLDLKGGPQKASTYQSRYLSGLCLKHPHILGSSGSKRRQRTKWLVDRWKRDTAFDETRAHLMMLADSSVLQPLPVAAPPATPIEKETPKPASPPKIINKSKESKSSMFSPNRSKGKICSSVLFVIGLIFYCFSCLLFSYVHQSFHP